MANNGTGHFEVAGHAVDVMGIFEWLCLTLQEEPITLSTHDYSLMLANRTEVGGDSPVPRGYWLGSPSHVGLGLDFQEDWQYAGSPYNDVITLT